MPAAPELCPHVPPDERVGDEAGFCVVCLRNDLQREREKTAALRRALRAALDSTRCRNITCDHSWHREGREALGYSTYPYPEEP